MRVLMPITYARKTMVREPMTVTFLNGTYELQGGPLTVGSYAFLRVEQVDGAWAWTSPWFVTN